MRLPFALTVFAFLLSPTRADDPSESEPKSERATVVQFLKEHVIGKTFQSAHETAKIANGKLEAEYSTRSRYVNLQETKTGFSFDVLEEVQQTNYPLGEDGRRTGPGQDVGREHTTQYQVVESLSTGELLGISIVSERTIGDVVFPAVISAIKLELKEHGLLLTSSDVWYHDEFSGEDKGWKPGTAEVTQTFALNGSEGEIRVKVRLFDIDPSSMEKTLSADVPERTLTQTPRADGAEAERRKRLD